MAARQRALAAVDRWERADPAVRALPAKKVRKIVRASRHDLPAWRQQQRELLVWDDALEKLAGEWTDPLLTIIERGLARDLVLDVRLALALLPEDEREIIERSTLAGGRMDVVAKRLGICRATAQRRKRRGFERLRRMLRRWRMVRFA